MRTETDSSESSVNESPEARSNSAASREALAGLNSDILTGVTANSGAQEFLNCCQLTLDGGQGQSDGRNQTTPGDRSNTPTANSGDGNRVPERREAGDRAPAKPEAGDPRPEGKPAEARAELIRSMNGAIERRGQLLDPVVGREVLTNLASGLRNVPADQAADAVRQLNQKFKDAGSRMQFRLDEEPNGARSINMRHEGERGQGMNATIAPGDGNRGPERREEGRAPAKPEAGAGNRAPERREAGDPPPAKPEAGDPRPEGKPGEARAELIRSMNGAIERRGQLLDPVVGREVLTNLASGLRNVPADQAADAVRQLNQKFKDAGSRMQFRLDEEPNGARSINMRHEGERGLGMNATISPAPGDGNRGPERREEGRSPAKPEAGAGNRAPERREAGDPPPAKPEAGDSNRRAERTPAETANRNFEETGRRFTTEMSREDRNAAHRQLADQLKRIGEVSGDRGVANAVSRLNDSLATQNSPYRFNTARMSNGQDFLTVRNAQDREFLSTVAISDERQQPGDRRNEGARPNEAPAPRETAESRDFLATGNRFSSEISDPAQRREAHNQLASQLRRISETSGEQGVRTAVTRLNENLERQGSPYRFNTARMSNGQDFITLRNRTGNLINTVAFSDEPGSRR